MYLSRRALKRTTKALDDINLRTRGLKNIGQIIDFTKAPVNVTELFKANREKVSKILETVDGRSADMFELVFMNSKTPTDVAEILDTSREEVEEKACATAQLVMGMLT